MNPLLDPHRLFASGFFLTPALVMALVWLFQRWRRIEFQWPHLLVSTLVFVLWAMLSFAEPATPVPWLPAVCAFGCWLVLTLSVLIGGSAWLPAASFFVLGIGAWILPSGELGLWLMGGCWVALLCLAFALLITSAWSAIVGYITFLAMLLMTGGWAGPVLGEKLQTSALSLETVQLAVTEPLWLLLLLLLPLLVWLSFRSLAGLGTRRRIVALGLRCFLIALIAAALADVHLRHGSEKVTVLFLWDRSLSIPTEHDEGGVEDLREKRLQKFINDAVAQRGTKHKDDIAGLIVFGKQPRLELPPSSVPVFNLKKIQSRIDDGYTDIGAAIKLALASCPEGTGKRLVLISDGNENLGKAEEQARIARHNGVQIDVVPVATGRRNPNEVLVERIEAPQVTEKDARLPVRVLVRSFNPNIVVGKLQLARTSLEQRGEEAILQRQDLPEEKVELRLGLNVFYLKQPGIKRGESYTYEAKFIPLGVIDARDKTFTPGLPGDRVENNRASTTVVAAGERAVLLIEPKLGDHKLLLDRLKASKPNLKIMAIEPGDLPRRPDELNLLMSRIDCVILANLPADRQIKKVGEEDRVVEGLSVEQQKVLRSNVQDQGCGMIVIGGPDAFGAGGWQNTELEKAWPVTCELEALKVEKQSGLVLIMHGSEIAEGNMWQKKIAKLAIEKLSPVDMVGMLYFDWGAGNQGHVWHIPFQEIGPNKAKILSLVNTMAPGDMPDAEPSLKLAHAALMKHDLGTRHIIFISDGDHWSPPTPLLRKMAADKVTCTTVCITSHGQDEIKKMRIIAQITGGRSYHVKDPSELPAIYNKETRLVSKSYVHEKAFVPQLIKQTGPTKDLTEKLQPLHGFVRTTKRPSALVEVPIQTPKIGDSVFPILAYWQYGLGRVAAFTSDARTQPGRSLNWWDRDWASSNMHIQFWDQVVDWTMRMVSNEKNLFLTTEQSGNRVKIIVTARDDKEQPLTDLELHGGLTSPGLKETNPKRPAFKFEQKNVGVYEAELKAEEVGSYFIHIKATRKEKVKGADGKEQEVETLVGSVRTGLTVPYSPEFAEMESNTDLLERLRDITGGRSYSEDSSTLNQVARTSELFRPVPVRSKAMQAIWFWLVFVAGLGLFLDVATRRIAVEPEKVIGPLQGLWSKLRGRAAAVAQTPQFLDRLKARKAQIAEGLAPTKAERRFEALEGATGPVPGATQDTGLPSKSTPRPSSPAPKVAPEVEQDAGDFASRLMKAKKRAMEERDKKEGK